MPWVLEIQLKEREDEQRFYISDGVVTIGRRDCDINLDDHKMSQHHCTLYLHSEQLSVVDHNSTNGIFINGIKVEKKELNNLDVMMVGTTRIKVRKEK
jgi:pSer/pThr/pTyr-binding forkhead associated (FHA) protein